MLDERDQWLVVMRLEGQIGLAFISGRRTTPCPPLRLRARRRLLSPLVLDFDLPSLSLLWPAASTKAPSCCLPHAKRPFEHGHHHDSHDAATIPSHTPRPPIPRRPGFEAIMVIEPRHRCRRCRWPAVGGGTAEWDRDSALPRLASLSSSSSDSGSRSLSLFD